MNTFKKYFKKINLLFNSFNSSRELSEIEINKLDKIKINELYKHKDLLNSLNKWMLFSDMNLISDIRKLGFIIKSIYKNEKMILYRGFDLDTINENLNLKNPKIFNKYKFKTLEKAVSFSRNKDIASAFGEIVIETIIDGKYDYLIITNELCYIISKMRNLKKIETQDEVILLPPFEINFKVIKTLT